MSFEAPNITMLRDNIVLKTDLNLVPCLTYIVQLALKEILGSIQITLLNNKLIRN